MEELEGQTLSRWQRWRASLNNRYLMTVMNEDTFEEVRSFRLNLGNVYLALSVLIVLVAVLMFLLLAYTPLQRYLPGYANAVEHSQLRELNREIQELEETLMAQDDYNQAVARLLMGEEYAKEYYISKEAIDSMIELRNQELEDTNVEPVSVSEEEMQIRRDAELASVGEAVRSSGQRPISTSDVPLEQMFFVAPVQGEITAAFDPNETKHNGVDIIAPKGTAIKAALEGYVIISSYTYDDGYTIGIQHDNGVMTLYKHNSRLLKEEGSYVKSGEAIAIIGNTGHQTTGPHLHFELWWKGFPVNPVEYVKF